MNEPMKPCRRAGTSALFRGLGGLALLALTACSSDVFGPYPIDGDVGADTGADSGADAATDSGGGGGPSVRPESITLVEWESTPFVDVTLALSTPRVNSTGGVVVITDTSSPAHGVEIEVPEGALPPGEEVTFTVEVADVTSIEGLPEGVEAQPRVFRIATSGSESWNETKTFDRAVRVTLPYQATEDAIAFYALLPDGTLEATGVAEVDEDALRYTFFTSTFADTTIAPRVGGAQQKNLFAELERFAVSTTHQSYIAIGLKADFLADLTLRRGSVNTGFLPSRHGWYIPNYGSFYDESRGGNCWGMAAYAAHHFAEGHPLLVNSYRDPAPTVTWLDDRTAIELASRVQVGLGQMWDDVSRLELGQSENFGWRARASTVALGLVGGMIVTGRPQVVYIVQYTLAQGTWNGSGHHAVSVYRADATETGFLFHIHDPNFVAEATRDARRVEYVAGTGFSNYPSGPTAADSSYQYNFFQHLGFYTGMSRSALEALKRSADVGFRSDSVFPTIEITAIRGNANSEDVMERTGTSSADQPMYITSDTAVVIEGTVAGGVAQTQPQRVDNLWVAVKGHTQRTPIDDAGRFQIVVPLKSGENMVVLLASDRANRLSAWAAFEQIVIESEASAASLTVTLTWGQDNSDVDLYVREPGGDGLTGDTVYYSNRRGYSAANPYLDFDNTRGYGPEHYIAARGTTSLRSDRSENPDGLYGDYLVKVHYYADHTPRDPESEEEPVTQPISWSMSWRYLAYCAEPCENPEDTGFWFSGGASGGMSVANSSSAQNIENSGPEWSEGFVIEYPRPDPSDFVVPPSHAVMLP